MTIELSTVIDALPGSSGWPRIRSPTMVRLDLDRIRRARTAIDPVFLDTPQYDCAPLGDVLGCSITLKVETLIPVSSFKGRGTETVLSWLAQREAAPSSVCASAGNLGQAMAYICRAKGVRIEVDGGNIYCPGMTLTA